MVKSSKRWLMTCVIAIGSQVLLSGCLETRTAVKETEEKQVLRKQVANLQQTTADVNLRFQDIEDELRRLSGRIDTIDKKYEQAAMTTQSNQVALEGKMNQSDTVYREEFSKLNGEILALKNQLAALHDGERKAAEAKAVAAAKAAQNPFAAAEQKFEAKSFKEAILDYEKYRKENPKGKQFAEATYKIGVSFQELGLTEEAKAFYQEVIAKFPKSKESKKASTRLKSIK